MKYIQATITVFSLINPVVSAAILSRIETGQPRGVRFTAATKGAVTIFIVLSKVLFYFNSTMITSVSVSPMFSPMCLCAWNQPKLPFLTSTS